MGSGQINPAILAEEAQPSPEVANFRPQSQIKFNVTEVAPPSNLYVTQNDVMLLTLFDFIAGHTVFLDYQILTPDGKLQIGEEAIVSIALPGSNVVRVQLPEGYLIRAAIRVNANNLQRGTLYCSLAIIRSPFTQNIRTVIAEGFVGQNVNIAWPYGYSEPSISGQGRLAIRTLSNPAAGAEVIYVPGQNQRTRMLGLVATLTTAVGTRRRPGCRNCCPCHDGDQLADKNPHSEHPSGRSVERNLARRRRVG